MVVGVIGGTGKLGRGMCRRLLESGYEVVVGSRSVERADSAAESFARELGTSAVSGDDNVGAATRADILILAVPADGMDDILPPLRDAVCDKVVIDASVRFGRPSSERPCAGERARRWLESGRVVAAFQTVPAACFQTFQPHLYDVLVYGDEDDAKGEVVRLSDRMGFGAFDAGVLADAWVAEALASTLVWINRRYRKRTAGISIRGLS